MHTLRTNIFKVIKALLISIGSAFLVFIILAFTSVPFWAQYWLGTQNLLKKEMPDYIVMLGGGGMPSEDNLIRLYFTAQLANQFKSAKVVIVHPKDSAVNAEMKLELIIRGIDSTRIIFNSNGTNTRAQAMSIVAMKGIKASTIAVITSSEQVFRSVKSFQALGCQKVFGVPAFNSAMYVDLSYSSKKLGGNPAIPDIGNNLKLRYNFWNYLKLEITCLREFFAIGYYKLNRWI